MAVKHFQIGRGTYDKAIVYTGLVGELILDTTNMQVRVHDGETMGGYPIAKDVLATSSARGLMAPEDKAKLDTLQNYVLPTAGLNKLGGVKTTSTVTSASGYTACPIISGVPYYANIPAVSLYIGAVDAKADAATSNGATYLKLFSDNTLSKQFNIKGSGATTVTSDASGSLIINSVNTTYTAATNAPLAPGTAAVGTSAKYAREDHVHPLQTTISGNAGTATKLANGAKIGISGAVTGTATLFDGSADITIPTTGIDVSKANAGTLPVSRGGTGQTSVANIQAGKDAAGNVITNTYATKTELNNLRSGLVQTVSALPETGTEGIIYLVPNTTDPSTYDQYTWENGVYVPLGNTSFNLGDYVKKENVVTALTISGRTITYTKGDGSTGTLTTQDNNTTYSAGTGLSLSGTTFSVASSAGSSALSWGTEVTLGTVGGLAIKAKLPANPNSDTKVTQNISTTSSTYPVLLTPTANANANVGASTAIFGAGIKANPSTGELIATKFTGALAGNANTATKATQDSAGQQINTTYIKGLSVSGKTITYTKGDGTTGTITTQDTNTTYSVATTSANGLMSAADKAKLDGLSNYVLPTAANGILGGVKTSSTVTSASGYTACPIIDGIPYYKDTNTTYTLSSLGIGNVKNYDQSKAISSITRSGTTFTYTCLDGTTGTFTQQDNNTWTAFKGATSSAAGTAGYVPAPAKGDQAKFFRADGTWAVPTNTTYSAGTGLTLSGTTFSVAANTYAAASHTHSYLPLSGGTVTGTLTLSRTTDASGTANNKPALIIGGTDTTAHIEIDANEILAKASDTTISTLNLNTDGGLVAIGNGGLSVGTGGVTTTGTFIRNHTSITKGTNPSSTAYWTITLCDKNGGNYANNCLGMFETSMSTAGVVSTYIRAVKNEAASSANCTISCIYDTANNLAYTSAPTPADNDNSTKIATTAWVQKYCNTTKKYLTSHQSLANYSTLANTIKDLSISGRTITYTKGDGTTGTLTTQDNNTTYSNFVKSGSGAKAGLVPAPSTTAGTTKYLREDGTWSVPPDTNTTYTFTAGTSTLAWNSEVTLATVGGLAIKAKLPANPNSDTKVTQNISTTNSTYPVLLTPTANATANVGANTAIFGSGIKANPSTGELIATKFTGALSGTATKATQDSAGQQINTTYIKGLSVSGKTITYTKGDGTTGTITTQDTNTTYTFTAGTSTLAWNTEVTLATVGGLAIKAKLPANPNTNTDTLVTQNVSTANATYPLLLCPTADATTNQGAKTAIFASGVKVNPSNGGLIVGTGGITTDGVITTTNTFAKKNTAITKGTNPTATTFWAVTFCDKDGTNYSNNCLGMFETSIDKNGIVKSYIRAMKNAAANSENCQISCIYDTANSKAYTEAPHPAVGDSTTKIATTAWVMNTANRKQCLVGQSGSTNTNPWYKFASFAATVANDDPQITFFVEQTYGARCSGILRCHVRLNGSIIYDTCNFDFLTNTGLDPAKFMLVAGTAAKPTIELWVKIDVAYLFYRFVVISEGKRTSNGNAWNLYNASSAGQAANPTSGTQVTATVRSVSNKAAALAWNTTSTIATVDGIDITVKLPDNPNTNTTYSAGTGLTLSGTTFSVKANTYAAASHTHSYLPLSGGTLTGDVTIQKASPVLYLRNTSKTRGTAPSAAVNTVELNGRDNANKNTWGIYQTYGTDKSIMTYLITYKGTTTDNTWTGLGIGYDASGNVVSSAPTPAAGDNSTKIATTAWVRTATGNTTLNAATATKLATARTIALSGAVTGSKTFDGSGNITIPTSLKTCYVTVEGEAVTNNIFKFATADLSSSYNVYSFYILIQDPYFDKSAFWCITIGASATAGVFGSGVSYLINNINLDVSNFFVGYKNNSGGSINIALYCKVPARYDGYRFTIISEIKRGGIGDGSGAYLTLTNKTRDQGTAAVDSGYTVINTTNAIIQSDTAGNAATATKAIKDSAGQQINTTYIKGLSVNGKTITYTKGDGTTGTITTQDTNTTYTFTAGTSALAWNSEVTLATVGGLAIKAKLPANPNTNTTYSAGTGLELSGTTFSVPATLPLGCIEFNRSGASSNNGGLIDFHYNQSTADYTSRIIESASGVLNINGATFTKSGTVVQATTFKGYLDGQAAQARILRPVAIPDDSYTDIMVAYRGEATSKRCSVIRVNNGNGYNEITMGVSNENDSAPSGITVRNTNGTWRITCGGHPAFGDHSTAIATTAWVHDNALYTKRSGMDSWSFITSNSSMTNGSMSSNTSMAFAMVASNSDLTTNLVNGKKIGGVGMYASGTSKMSGLKVSFYTSTTAASEAGFDMFTTGNPGSQKVSVLFRHGGHGEVFGPSPSWSSALSANEDTGTVLLGSTHYLWKQVCAKTATIATSDERLKTQIAPIPDEILDAWGDLQYSQFKWIDTVEQEGEAARLHVGAVAQAVERMFQSKGIDVTKYSFFCHTPEEPYEWTEEVEVEPGVKEEKVVKGVHPDRYALRYADMLVIEAVYQRRRADRLEARLSRIEKALNLD